MFNIGLALETAKVVDNVGFCLLHLNVTLRSDWSIKLGLCLFIEVLNGCSYRNCVCLICVR